MGYTNASCAEHRTQNKSIMAVNETKQSPSSPSCELHARKNQYASATVGNQVCKILLEIGDKSSYV